MALFVVAALAIAGVFSGCGGDAEQLSKGATVEFQNSRSDLDDALDTTETLRTSHAEAARLRARVRRIIGEGSFENGGKPDEFGYAALGQLRDVAPSLMVEQDGSLRSLDAPVARSFLRYAVSDPKRALHPAAEEEVDNLEQVLDHADHVGPDTRLRDGVRGIATRQTVSAYLAEAQRDVEADWPDLGRRLGEMRDDL